MAKLSHAPPQPVGAGPICRNYPDAATGIGHRRDQLTRPLVRESDVVVVSAPLNENTAGMIGAEQLRLLGPDGVLINVGRGPLVHEQALYDALASGVIWAAAIDIWYRYPSGDGATAPSGLPFAELSNILMTPHPSGVTRDTFSGRADDIAANIGRLQRGEVLRNTVDFPARTA
jgi:phosphoglycerate dehydrogenase-like enzyme